MGLPTARLGLPTAVGLRGCWRATPAVPPAQRRPHGPGVSPAVRGRYGARGWRQGGTPGRPKLLRGAVRWGLEARPRPKVAATSRSFYAVGLILRIRGRHNVPICYIQYRIHTLDSSTCGRQFWSPTPLTKTVVVIQVAGCVSHRAPALPRPLRVAGDAPLGGARDAGSSARRAGVEAAANDEFNDRADPHWFESPSVGFPARAGATAAAAAAWSARATPNTPAVGFRAKSTSLRAISRAESCPVGWITRCPSPLARARSALDAPTIPVFVAPSARAPVPMLRARAQSHVRAPWLPLRVHGPVSPCRRAPGSPRGAPAARPSSARAILAVLPLPDLHPDPACPGLLCPRHHHRPWPALCVSLPAPHTLLPALPASRPASLRPTPARTAPLPGRLKRSVGSQVERE